MPIAFSIFADDLRNEVGNRSSLMGIYSRSINFANFPATLARLAVCTILYMKRNEQIFSLTIRIVKDGKELAKNDVPAEFLTEFRMTTELSTQRGELYERDDVELTVNSLLDTILLDAPGKISVILVVNGVQLPAGEIRIARAIPA